ncbi:GPW/gp25 family protein [Aquimarina addita]|uniref:GPW/gp25 family protein n=1 Tax=Aquimarina addita TaxID=870485 RepID=A0ABP6ULP4_9FLAO
MKNETPYIGIGWSFPPAFNKFTSQVEMTTEDDDIEGSLEIILTTKLGERLLRPLFGCDLSTKVFETMNATQVNLIKNMIEECILLYEPRIDTEDIKINTNNAFEGIFYIHIDYTVRTTNSRRNIVFPFYLNEGTDL